MFTPILLTTASAPTGNWIIDSINRALDGWNDKLAELWQIISMSPSEFKGGAVWSVMVTINDALKATAYGLLVLFFAFGVLSISTNLRDFRKPEVFVKHLLRFVIAKEAVSQTMNFMNWLYGMCAGIISTIGGRMSAAATATHMPTEIADAIQRVNFINSIPLWLVSVIGSLVIMVLSFMIILTAYGRFFRLYLYTAMAPIPLSTFAGEATSSMGKAFIKSYIGVVLEGAIIMLSCIIFSKLTGASQSGINTSDSPVTQAWTYLGEVTFSMILLLMTIRSSDRIIREMLGT